MNKDIKEAIEKTASETAEKIKCANMIRDNEKSAYQKTESLLYSYNDFLKAVKNREEEIKEIKEHGLRKHSNSILPASNQQGRNLTDQEKADMLIAEIELSIAATKRCLNNIDRIMLELNEDPYYEPMKMKYMSKMTRIEISKVTGIPERTLSRGCSRLVRRIAVELFTDQMIKEILYGF